MTLDRSGRVTEMKLDSDGDKFRYDYFYNTSGNEREIRAYGPKKGKGTTRFTYDVNGNAENKVDTKTK